MAITTLGLTSVDTRDVAEIQAEVDRDQRIQLQLIAITASLLLCILKLASGNYRSAALWAVILVVGCLHLHLGSGIRGAAAVTASLLAFLASGALLFLTDATGYFILGLALMALPVSVNVWVTQRRPRAPGHSAR